MAFIVWALRWLQALNIVSPPAPAFRNSTRDNVRVAVVVASSSAKQLYRITPGIGNAK